MDLAEFPKNMFRGIINFYKPQGVQHQKTHPLDSIADSAIRAPPHPSHLKCNQTMERNQAGFLLVSSGVLLHSLYVSSISADPGQGWLIRDPCRVAYNIPIAASSSLAFFLFSFFIPFFTQAIFATNQETPHLQLVFVAGNKTNSHTLFLLLPFTRERLGLSIDIGEALLI